MASIFITSAANPYSYAEASTQTVTDAVALAAEAAGWGILSSRRTPNTPSPGDVERTDIAAPGGGSGITALSQATDYQSDLVAPLAAAQAAAAAAQSAANAKAPAGNTVQITANVTINAANATTYNGQILEFTGAYTVTIDAGCPANFGFAGIPPATGVASIASDGTTLLNGATTTITISAASYVMFAIAQRNTNANSYVVVN